ncbi:MAG: hypothetical protein NZM06_09915 [Chloroherpetonaceae bacterium]|nr:hypothetical protein [Chloroherpetonaceae bacterium]MDW8437734.1 hypothetical protein [Chloroherpetonaceae bacterium]
MRWFLLATLCATVVASCKNPAAPREPNKFASQATFIRRLDSIRVGNATILLSSGAMRNALSLPSGDLLFVGELERPGAPRTAFAIRTNAVGGTRWARLYADSIETFAAIVPSGERDFIAVGSVFSGPNQTSGYAIKIDSLGGTLWARSFSDAPRSLRFAGAIRQANGNALLYGQTRRVVSAQSSLFINDGYVAAIDANGNAIFARRIRSLGSLSNTPSADIGFNGGASVGADAILAGFYTPIYDFVKAGVRRLVAPDLYLLRLNATGDSTASFLYDALYPAGDVLDQSVSYQGKLNTADEALSILPMSDGTFAVFGRSNASLYLLFVNASLNGVLRRVVIPNVPSRFFSQFALARDGNFVFVGASTEKIAQNGIRSPAPGGRDVYIAKMTPQGNLIWEITHGTTFDDIGLTIQETIDGGFIVTGTSNDKPLLLKVDERGLLAQ